jgi:hypothetical protein
VDEVAHSRLGDASADEARSDVEVVVMEEDGRLRLARELLDDSVRERPVDRQVAVRPGLVEAVVDVRRLDESPEIVLREPENGVGDDVVVEVVGLRVVSDEPQLVRRAIACGLLHRLATTFGRNDTILSRHRARHPGDVVVRDQTAESGHEPSPASAGAPRPVVSRENVTGARFETTISFRRPAMADTLPGAAMG